MGSGERGDAPGFRLFALFNLNRQNTNTNGSIHFASVSRARRTTSRARSGRRALSADAKHARLAEHSTSSSLKVERTMAALTASMANMAVAAKAQRVGGVRRIAAKASVARVGGLKAPASAHMRTGTRPARVALGLSLSSRVVSPGSARSRPPRSPPGARIPASARAVPRKPQARASFSPAIPLTSPPPRVPGLSLAGARRSVGVFAAGLDFAELEEAASVDEEEEWTPPVVRAKPRTHATRAAIDAHQSPPP
jgi:hypothetical protein